MHKTMQNIRHTYGLANGENIILIPCNPAYHTMVTDYEEIRIVGRCVGCYHSYV